MEKTNITTSDTVVLRTVIKEKEPCLPLFIVQRIVALLAVFTLFLPGANPVNVSKLIPTNRSLFTSAVNYSGLISGSTERLINKGHINQSSFNLTYVAAILLFIGVVCMAAATCCSLGNLKFKRLAVIGNLAGSVLAVVGCVMAFVAKGSFANSPKPDKAEAQIPYGLIMYMVFAIIVLVTTIVTMISLPKANAKMKYEMESKYKLFIMLLPFLLLVFVFAYLPLWGWRYSFFDYDAGAKLSKDNFVGMKWFKWLFTDAQTRSTVAKVLRNTLVMSGLGILTSWIPLAFAILLTEIENKKFKKFVQTFTTIPNFISWIIVYAIAFAIFSSDGFINSLTGGSTNYLLSDSGIWFKMLAWGIWKGTGWGAIIYIAGISGIDRQLYEAATVDGASRFQRIWNVTIPGLIPTYMVMLLMAVAGALSNGLDQYLVFSNAKNMDTIQVLDLYVYKLGLSGSDGNIPLSTVIGMAKSIVSVTLLFMANGISKTFRGESIV